MKISVAALTCLVCAGVTSWAAAQDPEPSTESSGTPEADAVSEARDAFVRGTALAREGNWTEALSAFERSAALRPHAVTTYNIGFVERALGRYTRARATLRDSLAPDDPSEETLPPDLAEEARHYLDDVTGAIGRIPIAVEPRDAAVSVDGRPLVVDGDDPSTVVAGIAPPGDGEPLPEGAVAVLVDPGPHVVVLSKKGSPDRVFRKTVARGARDPAWKLELPETRRDTPKAKAPAPEPNPTDDETPSGTPDRTITYIALGAGTAGLIAGSVFGIVALSEHADLEEICGPDRSCPRDRRDDLDRLELHANLATVGFVVAGVGGALGLTLLFGESDANESASVRASVGPGAFRIDGRF